MLTTRNFLELKGSLVYLKKLDKSYTEEYWQAFDASSIETMIFTGTQAVFSKSDLERYLESISSDRSRVDFLIFSKDTNEIVGEVVLNEINRNNSSANIRILIFHKDNFGKGYGTEAMTLALHYGFGMLGLHRIELGVLPFNDRAVYTYEKIGFQREGILRDGEFFNHRYHDLIVMSMLEHEFREKYLDKDLSIKDF